MTKYINGNEFLNKIYKDLHLSEEVKHVSNTSDSQIEKIGKFINRLDRVHNKANTEGKKDRIKKLYHNKYVIKREKMAELSTQQQDEVIDAQINKLDDWIDYLTCDDARYPMWIKYWAFQGMLKIGTYDETTGTYGKRSDKTVSPFIDVDPEVLNKCMDLVMKTVDGKEIDDIKLDKLVESGNFQKLYTLLFKENHKKKIESSGFEGKWIKYGIGNKEDAVKLYNSLQGYATEWCTAGSLYTATNQICGGGGYSGGDFYVYYTKDEKGEYKIPRIAIRMDGRREIGEIRGIDEIQNLEVGLEDIIESKLNEMLFLDEKDKSKCIKIIENLRELTRLNKKTFNKEELTKEEQEFIFVENIVTFGYLSDSRIKTIRARSKITYPDIAYRAILEKKDGSMLKYVSDKLKKDRNLILEAIKINGLALQFAPAIYKNDREIVFEAIKQDGYALQFASNELKNDKKIVLEASNYGIQALQFASIKLKDDKEFVLEIVRKDGKSLEFVSNELKKDRDVVLSAIKQDGTSLQYASHELRNDREIVLEAIKQDGSSLQFASNELKNDKEIVLKVINQSGVFLQFASNELKNDRDVVLSAIKKDGYSLQYASNELRSDREIVLEAIKQYGSTLEFASNELKKDREIVLAAVSRNGYALRFASDELKKDEEISLEAIKRNCMCMQYVSEELKNNVEFVMKAIKNNKYVFDFISPSMQSIITKKNNSHLRV